MDAPAITGQPFYKLSYYAVSAWGGSPARCVCVSEREGEREREAETCSHAALCNERAGQPLNGH